MDHVSCRDAKKLKYWIHLLTTDETRLVREVYQQSKEDCVERKTRNWAYSIRELAQKYDLVDLWQDEEKVFEVPSNINTRAALIRYWSGVIENLHRRATFVEERN